MNVPRVLPGVGFAPPPLSFFARPLDKNLSLFSFLLCPNSFLSSLFPFSNSLASPHFLATAPKKYTYFFSTGSFSSKLSLAATNSSPHPIPWPPKVARFPGGQKSNHDSKIKMAKNSSSPGGGLQICPSSVELTSVRNMNTRVKSKCE